jgi:2-iminobutanoate/2-iminopropanoate deaminase
LNSDKSSLKKGNGNCKYQNVSENTNNMKITHKTITTPDAPAPIGPYSQARESNGMIFISGQIALNPKTGEIMQESVEVETHQVMMNLIAILKAASLSTDDILKTTIYLTNMDDFEKVNKIYAQNFTEYFPARETVEVRKLPKGARVEISCIAARP